MLLLILIFFSYSGLSGTVSIISLLLILISIHVLFLNKIILQNISRRKEKKNWLLVYIEYFLLFLPKQTLLEYAEKWKTSEDPLPLLEVYTVAIQSYVKARPYLTSECENVALVLERLALWVDFWVNQK